MHTSPKPVHELMFERLAEGLDGTTKLTHTLLIQLRESESDFAAVKTELSILRDNVKGLSNTVRDGNGEASLITKIALIEHKIDIIDKWLDDHVVVHQSSKENLDKLKDILGKEIEELEKRIAKLENIVSLYSQKVDEEERRRKERDLQEASDMRKSISREEDLAFERKKLDQKHSDEVRSFWVKVIGAVALTLASAFAGWFANQLNTTATPEKEVPQIKAK